jgi:hypothetical protein
MDDAAWRIEVVKRSAQAKGFEVIPRRWVVERTIAWINRCRRLAKDYENLNRTAIAFIRLASISLMLQPVHPGEGFADLAEFNSALARHVFWYLKRCAVRDDLVSGPNYGDISR